MSNYNQSLIFQQNNEEVHELIVSTFCQYLIIRNGGDRVQGILTVFDEDPSAYDYQQPAAPDNCHENHGMLLLNSVPSDAKQDILDAMSEKGISILDSEIVPHTTLFLPCWSLYEHHGNLKEALDHKGINSCHWSLHVFS